MALIVPTQPRETDFARVRDWNLNGVAKHFRQTLLFSRYQFPELALLARTACANVLVRTTGGGARTSDGQRQLVG